MTLETGYVGMPPDYIIVGAGSAGCVLAHRLSANPATSVLLVEAGPEDTSPSIAMPKGIRRTHRDPKLVWRFRVTADAGRGEWRGSFLGGKVLGGTSAINSMLYVRGQPQDYDDWVALGAPGWGWSAMAPCFKMIEDHHLGASDTRGAGGPLHVGSSRARDAVCEAFIQAGVALGLRQKDDLNELDQEGIGFFPTTIEHGRRVSAARAFLAPIRTRANLTVATGTLVTKILFDGRRAVGVEGITRGVRREFRAGRGVVVCAGALQSPKLLQLSGVGPAAHLHSLGVPVVCDSPGVGANLRDHWGLRLQFRLVGAAGHNRWLRGLGLRISRLRYSLFRTGILSSAPAEVGAFVKAMPGTRRADAELHFSPFSVVPNTSAIERQPGLQCTVRSLRPESQGSVGIRCSDPMASPEIRGNFLTADYDQRLTVEMVRYVRNLVRQAPLRPYVGEETFPGPVCRSDSEIVDTCRRLGSPGSHFAGTCKMGQDRMAVVDERLRVRGVSGLRVVDGSIMPTLVSGNTNGPIMAIGWRAADLILEEAARDVRSSHR